MQQALTEFSEYNTKMRQCLEMVSDTSVPLFAELQKWVKKFSLCCDLLDAILTVWMSPSQETAQKLACLLEQYNSDAVILTGFCLREAAERTIDMVM